MGEKGLSVRAAVVESSLSRSLDSIGATELDGAISTR